MARWQASPGSPSCRRPGCRLWSGSASWGFCLPWGASRRGSPGRRSSPRSRFAATVAVVAVAAQPRQTWSAYYRIDRYDAGIAEAIDVNGIPHQAMWPLDYAREEPIYNQVYTWFPDRTFERVLIIGAGSGTDVAMALDQGATHVDAVEIDAAIQQIGLEAHPAHPYDDPRVTRINDDGRAFLRRATDEYDLVVFALPDSLTLVSTSANLRLESFLFTTEAFEEVRSRLAPDGLFVLYNVYFDDRLPTKIGGMLEEVFGAAPAVRLHGATAATLAAGPLLAPVRRHPAGRTDRRRQPGRGAPRPPLMTGLSCMSTRRPSSRTTSARSCFCSRSPRSRSGAPRGAAGRRCGGSVRTSSSWASRSCSSRREASSPSASCSGRPGSLTPWSSSRCW